MKYFPKKVFRIYKKYIMMLKYKINHLKYYETSQ